jgi:hypothetical protein
MWGQHTIDQCSTRASCQPLQGDAADPFCSLFFHPAARWTDTFSGTWAGEVNWVCLPFPFVGEALAAFRASGAPGTLNLPRTSTEEMWPLFQRGQGGGWGVGVGPTRGRFPLLGAGGKGADTSHCQPTGSAGRRPYSEVTRASFRRQAAFHCLGSTPEWSSEMRWYSIARAASLCFKTLGATASDMLQAVARVLSGAEEALVAVIADGSSSQTWNRQQVWAGFASVQGSTWLFASLVVFAEFPVASGARDAGFF